MSNIIIGIIKLYNEITIIENNEFYCLIDFVCIILKYYAITIIIICLGYFNEFMDYFFKLIYLIHN